MYALKLIDNAIENEADHIVISGDLVNSQEMDVVKTFMARLGRRKWATAERLTVVPGNHDIFPGGFARPRRPWTVFPEFSRLTKRTRVGAKSKGLIAGESYPFGKVLSSNVALAGLDTTWNDSRNPLNWASGELEEEHIDKARDFFAASNGAQHKVLVIHHYPYPTTFPVVNGNFSDPEPSTSRNWLRFTGATLVLCGHWHGSETKLMGKNCRLVCSGATGDDGDYHMIDLPANGNAKVTRR
jgi:3',5'-cyclic AMP phosphodiesterase CpdA